MSEKQPNNVIENEKVLFVDDDPNALRAYKRHLRKYYRVHTVLSGKEGLEAIKNDGPFGVIVSDLMMPEMDGIEFLTLANERSPSSIRIMLTGFGDMEKAMRAINEGHVFRFETKPCKIDKLIEALEDGFRQYNLTLAEKSLHHTALKGSIKVITDMLTMIDGAMFGRAMKLRQYAKRFARRIKLDTAQDLELAAMLSQTGFLTVPVEIRQKILRHEKLNSSEEMIVRNVSETGFNLLSNIPKLERIAHIIRYGKKSYNGKGFPKDDVAGNDIPVESRILNILSDLIEIEERVKSKREIMSTIRDKKQRYDPKLLSEIIDEFIGFRTRQPLLPPKNSITVEFDEMMEGDILLTDLRSPDGKLLLAQGSRLTRPILSGLKRHTRFCGIEGAIQVLREKSIPTSPDSPRDIIEAAQA